MPSRILITGADGFIGCHLSEKLLSLNHTVIALVHSKKLPGLNSLENAEKLTIVQGDIRDPEFTNGLFREYPVDIVFHLAIASPSKSDTDNDRTLHETESFQTNFTGTLNLLNAAIQTGISAWIQSSTMSVYNFENPDYIPVDEKHPTNPQEIYGFSKLLAEQACHYYSNSDLKTIILRYSGVFGWGKKSGIIARFTKSCHEDSNEIFCVAANRSSDFIYVGDVVTANIQAMNKLLNPDPEIAGKPLSQSKLNVYNIGSGEEISALNVVHLIRELCKNESVRIEKVAGESRRFVFDISLAQKELGFSPGTVRQGLMEYITQIKK